MKITETQFALGDDAIYMVDGQPAIFDGWNQDAPSSGPHIDDFFCGGEYLGEDEDGLGAKFRLVGDVYYLTATHDDGGNRCQSDRATALGDIRACVFNSREEAEELARELADDVGDVVDESTQYHVELFVG